MSNERAISAQKELFLEYLFNDSECMGDTLMAVRKAGFEEKKHSTIVRELKDEILKRSQEKLAMQAPKAISKLVNMLDEDGSTPKAEIRLKAVESVLDRVGVAKKQQIDVAVDNSSPLFFITQKENS